ncbi:hypothetical protein RIF23_18555 [Lipingzhangella sp. LS1_29]|uniref:Uncharacterized protein n=1 Tax=Lipingzhangella rawalii TaxID=2055835 RepID=A0ABU2HBV4_9ACTN|nr:hypothetical protein [Lipingzhangella rawalii]MDS1272295.1 hypothetical protein [Lipingzhangella rawalii]
MSTLPNPAPQPFPITTAELSDTVPHLILLAKELRRVGLEAKVDASLGVVDAWVPDDVTATGYRVRAIQRVALRTLAPGDTPWWWLLWPEERFRNVVVPPELELMAPVEEARDMARRVRKVLVLTDEE